MEFRDHCNNSGFMFNQSRGRQFNLAIICLSSNNDLNSVLEAAPD